MSEITFVTMSVNDRDESTQGQQKYSGGSAMRSREGSLWFGALILALGGFSTLLVRPARAQDIQLDAATCAALRGSEARGGPKFSLSRQACGLGAGTTTAPAATPSQAQQLYLYDKAAADAVGASNARPSSPVLPVSPGSTDAA
ncbi:MAG: hypothetical protein H7Z19_08810, partial [Chitinophagaceae bacterium]|nr:hypothetical protein [Rubrivivax sp.]